MPVLLRDADITTEYPADVDDENLSSQGFSPALPGELTKISSSLALFRVCRILSKTLDHLYPSKASYQLSLSKLHSISDELDQWSEELPEHLRLRFCNDKPSTNLISDRSPILVCLLLNFSRSILILLQSLVYFFVRSLTHRPLLCHGSGSARSAATIVLAAAGKHTLQIMDLLDERRMNYTCPFPRKELLLISAFSILWQSIELDEESKLVKDNQKSLSLVLNMLNRHSQPAATELQRIATAFVSLESRRMPSPSHISIDTPAAKLLNESTTQSTQGKDNDKSKRKQLQAIAARFSNLKRPEEGRRATVPQTAHSQSLSPHHRAGSSVSLSSTRSAPVMLTPSPSFLSHPRTFNGPPSINLDYFPMGDEGIDGQTSTSSSTMLPPKKPAQLSPNIANASWDNLLNTNFDATSNSTLFAGVNTPGRTPMDLTGNEWIQDGWDLPSMDLTSKAPVPQSLLSFSGESMTSGDDIVFSASSNNGSTSTRLSDNAEVPPTSKPSFKGITIPVDDDFDFPELDGN